MAVELKKATRKQVKLRLGISGPSGSGKTYSGLLLAYGMTGDWNKIAVIDTENESASLYSHLGEFYTVAIKAPYTPEKYSEALKACEDAGIEVVVIDSITHEWSGKGGCLDIHEAETQKMKVPNSFTAWAQVTPRHQAFIDSILHSQCHVITTVRSKTEYVMTERNGRQVPQKMGMAAVTREGFEYELTLSFEVDITHKASAGKDRTGLFMDKKAIQISEETGKEIIEWCNSGEKTPEPSEEVLSLIDTATEESHLTAIFKDNAALKDSQKFLNALGKKKAELKKMAA